MAWEFKQGEALLILDMLNDFIDEAGSLLVPGASRIVPRIRELIEGARAAGVPVIYVCDTHRPDDAEFEHWPPHGVEGSWGGKVVDELAPLPGDHIVHKRRYSAFFGTDLELTLSEMGVRRVLLAGVLTNICVWVTAYDASMRNFDVTVFRDAVASFSEETDAFVLSQLEQVMQADIV